MSMVEKEHGKVALQNNLAEEIGAIVQYVADSENNDNSNQAELHKAIVSMHDDFPNWLRQRIAFMNNESETSNNKKDSNM